MMWLGMGTGSAFQAWVLAERKAMGLSIERQKQLFDDNLNLPVLRNYPSLRLFFGDGFCSLVSRLWEWRVGGMASVEERGNKRPRHQWLGINVREVGTFVKQAVH